MSLRDQIKQAGIRKPVKVHLPEWGFDVYVRVMTVGERDFYENLWLSRGTGGVKDFRSHYLVRVLCDETGKRIYGDDDVAEVAALDGSVLAKVFDIAAAHNKLTEADVRELAGE